MPGQNVFFTIMKYGMLVDSLGRKFYRRRFKTDSVAAQAIVGGGGGGPWTHSTKTKNELLRLQLLIAILKTN